MGTARQTGWLGTLVIVPSAFWIVRRRRHIPVVTLAVTWLLCLIFIFSALNWFNHQMYATVETSENMGHDPVSIVASAIRVFLEISFFLLPILVAFLPQLARRRAWLILSAAGVSIFLAVLFLRPDSYALGVLLAPPDTGVGDYVTPVGILELPAVGSRPVVLHTASRAIISVVTYLSAFGFLVALVQNNRKRPATPSESDLPHHNLSWSEVFILLVPFTVAYCAFLGLRVSSGLIFDRYLLPLFIVFALVIARFYQ